MATLIIELGLASAFLLSRDTSPDSKQLFPNGPEYKDSALRLSQGKGYTTTILDCQHRPATLPTRNSPTTRRPPTPSIRPATRRGTH